MKVQRCLGMPWRSPPARLRLAALAGAAAVLATMGVSLATPGDELIACRSQQNGVKQVTVRADRWVRINAPKFDAGEGPSTLAAFAAMPDRPNGLVVTNGTVVKLSVDAGCTWETVYRGNNVQAPVPGYTPDVFSQLVAPTDSQTWVTSYDDVDGVPHPHVYVGQDIGVDGKTPAFTQLDVGLPAYGKPVSLAVSPLGLGEAYLLVDQLPDPTSGPATTPSRHLYGTYVPNSPPDAGAVTGRAWQELTPPSGFGRIDGMVRQSPNRIWIWSGRGFASTSNADASSPTWQVGTADGRIATIDVDAMETVRIVEQTAQGAMLAAPAGAHVAAVRGLPVVPAAFTHGTQPDVYVASGNGKTWGLDHRLERWVDITPHNGPGFTDLAMGAGTTQRIVLGLTSSALWRWDTFAGETFVEPPPPPVGRPMPYHPYPVSNLKAPQLTPMRQVVTVSPGAVNKVPVTFSVPPAPHPLDVYFLVDTTSSMQPAITGLQRAVVSIARDIRGRLGESACFGVGAFKDFATDASGVSTDPNAQPPYVVKTFLRVDSCDASPTLVKVQAAAGQLQQGGGFDTPEAQTVALTQAVTGAGQTYLPVPAGQEAGFRHEAFKVIVLITDSPSHEGNGYPTVAQAIQTLNTADVKVVSIAINDGAGDINGAKQMMNTIARGTNSYAPASGVDCNGDGGGYYGDLGPGAPLVCEESVTAASDGTSIVNIGPAILGLLVAVRDPGTIAVQVDDPDRALKASIDGLTSDVRDLKYENTLRFILPLGCSANQVGKDLPVALTPMIRSLPIGLNGQVVVQCRVAPPAPPLPVAAAPAAVIFPQLARPPVAVAAPAPPNAPPQPPSNVNVNTGMAHEEEQQPQLATAVQDADGSADDPAGEIVAMSAAHTSSTSRDVAFVFGAALVLTAAAGCQLRLRRRTAYAE